MEKKIIATTLSGLFIKSEPWKKAHYLWFDEMANKLGDPSIKEWAPREDYFKGVDEVMKRLYPELNDSERTIKARRLFFDSVLKYIEKNPSVRNQEVITYFKELKDRYKIGLITTTKKDVIGRILEVADIKNLFDMIEASESSEKDDNKAVFRRFIEKYGKPSLYIGSGGRMGDDKDGFEFCKSEGISCFFANFENGSEISGVESVSGLGELKEKVISYGL